MMGPIPAREAILFEQHGRCVGRGTRQVVPIAGVKTAHVQLFVSQVIQRMHRRCRAEVAFRD